MRNGQKVIDKTSRKRVNDPVIEEGGVKQTIENAAKGRKVKIQIDKEKT